MRENFPKSMPVILAYEGGYSNHPRDPGGVTLEGIIQRVYDAYRKRKGRRVQPLTKAMRFTQVWQAERNEIYKVQYWDAVRGDELPAGLDLVMFDSGIMSGPYQAILWLQRALGLNADGHLGEGTLDAIENHPDHDALIADICRRRLGMLQHLSTWGTFGKGWASRVANLKQIGQAWATGSVGPQPVAAHQQLGDAKAYASDVAQPAVDANDAVKASVGSGSIAGVLEGARDTIAPAAYSSEILTKVYTAIVILCVIASLGALLYSFWSNYKSKKARRAIDGDVLADMPAGEPA
ncbi:MULTISPECIES: glycoside hydrolase family 108 protein [unclassified Bradyrhizobium]|uniref:glycoside hydrolase family 108 protein n=1 Tax=unclassified Bradyrhizobium TaxID=2631580 RepID=UPI00211E2075|nr:MULTISPECIES: glycoside hydrolase family 108 protein [unclassified Bradyrhizobium]MDD1534598.1 N-acetylmuramidase [Bradyrhizobium sp. WBOS8]MDD1581462.1 N-acetylmuramidase [Bradyrhizobium sp. WBOS4]UUO49748.1 N-acetylmuramidase [Bradyrhizobium sp. WBOS04]UUO58514.1 N-acetylmuramidase [Bradyrhizobium sp. WBOS08]